MIPNHKTAIAIAGFLALTGCREQRTVAIVDVTVINPIDGTRREHVTVVTRGDRISEVGDAAAIHAPRGASIVDGRGNFLLPGFWDMHTHVWKPERLRLYLASGITGIRNTGGRMLELRRWRREIEAGHRPGPRMIISGPLLERSGTRRVGNSIAVDNEQDAESAIRGLEQAKVDFVKVYDGLSREAFFAIASEAQQRNMPFVGHVPDALSPIEASNAGMRSIEHLDGIVEACSSGETWDPDRAAKVFSAFLENETWQVPTLVAKRAPSEPAFERSVRAVREMHKAGVRFMAGTDADNAPLSFPGSSLHEELALLVDTGFSPMDALRAATSGPAEFLKRPDMGKIAPGAVADLVLLSADPTIDIANSRRVSATIAAGRLYDPAAR